jgi:transcriptional regulator with XRE-family HTH domain
MTGAQMRTLREKQNWSQDELASWLGITRNTVARMERDETVIPVPLARLTLLIMDKKNQQKILQSPLQYTDT